MTRIYILECFIGLLFLFSCKPKPSKERVFNFLYDGQWDSLKAYVEKPSDDLLFIIESSPALEHEYDFILLDSTLVVTQNGNVLDTVNYSWNEISRKVQFDSLEILKFFSKEKSIRASAVSHFIAGNKPMKAWNWLNYPEALDIDSLYGNFFVKMYYSVGLPHFASAIPRIKRAWEMGHDNSGLALSFWYILEGNREEGIKILKSLASRRNSEAMVELAQIYDMYFSEFGYDPPADAKLTSTFYWYSKAAALRNPWAMFQLATIYESGMNKAANMDSAVYWYRESAELGECLSSISLGKIFLAGEYFEENYDSSEFWFDRAILQDPSCAYFNLGKIYEEGEIVEGNADLALQYYLKADSLGSPVAKIAIKRMKQRAKN